jgi:hypothetical protein
MDLTIDSDFLLHSINWLVVVVVTVLFSVSCQPNFWPAFVPKRQIRTFQNHRVGVSLFEFLYQARGENGATVLCYGKVYTDKMANVMTISACGLMTMANYLSRACEIGLPLSTTTVGGFQLTISVQGV